MGCALAAGFAPEAAAVFESLSRTVTCTKELSAFICVIPRRTDLIPPGLDYHI